MRLWKVYVKQPGFSVLNMQCVCVCVYTHARMYITRGDWSLREGLVRVLGGPQGRNRVFFLLSFPPITPCPRSLHK